MTDWKDGLKTMAAAVSPVGYLAFKGVEKLVSEQSQQLQGKSSAEAAAEAERVRLATEMIQAQARAEQELAIADRIRTATEVEIEDFYDASGRGGLGLDLKSENLGLSGAGQKVVRRVIRLKGWQNDARVPTEVVRELGANGSGSGNAGE